jgi:hypothetical protein
MMMRWRRIVQRPWRVITGQKVQPKPAGLVFVAFVLWALGRGSVFAWGLSLLWSLFVLVDRCRDWSWHIWVRRRHLVVRRPPAAHDSRLAVGSALTVDA